MKRSVLFFLALVIFCFQHPTIFAQEATQDTTLLKKFIRYTSELEFEYEVRQYVYNRFLEYGEHRIPQERFLVSLMRLVNKEVARRLKDPKQARKRYFNSLYQMLEEIQQLKTRLRASGIRELDHFVLELEARIRLTLERGEIDFKKKKVFEDALQMLYVAEEMIRLDQLNQPEGARVSQQISQSKEKLLSAFGEVPAEAPSESQAYTGPKPTIYDLFLEWRKVDLLKFQVRLADVKLARRNLLKSGGLEHILRMFNDQLFEAYSNFNFGNYDLADRLLEDLIETYPEWGIQNLDDVYFYRAECNYALQRYLTAQEIYEELLEKYPGTAYLPRVYSRLVMIYYNLENYDRVVDYALAYQGVASQSDPDFYDIQFLLAMAYQRLGNLNESVEVLYNIPQNHPYYYLAQYFIANAYAENQLFDDAVAIYITLVRDKKTPKEIYARSVYKLGIVEYERGNYDIAIQYLQLVPEEFPNYDKVLNALAWAHFELERSKPIDAYHDFSLAKFYAQKILDEYYSSPYRMEAKSLLAYIKQMENEPLEAIDLYRQVYTTKVKKRDVISYLEEKDRLQQLYYQATRLKEKALQKNKPEAFIRASEIAEKLRREIEALDLAEVSASGSALYNEINRVTRSLAELDSLRLRAIEEGNERALKKIDSLSVRLLAVLETFPVELIARARQFNWFDAYPVSRYVGEEEFRFRKVVKDRQEIMEDIAQIDAQIAAIQERLIQARAEKDYSLVIRLEQKLNQMKDIRKYYDQLFASTYHIEANPEVYPEFAKWGDFGAFGIINVHFDQRRRIQNRIAEIARVLDKVNRELNQRQQVIESKIKKIEAEIRFMTMKARMEERARLRAERERAFRESYFDTRTSEFEEQ
ncbi:MAG: tetratricopeptide repeat protein [Calditrichaeota bacterium]|nr:tetratricopeptide repeat protein [Calditrichota bacterium]